jgi:hypothetical protein
MEPVPFLNPINGLRKGTGSISKLFGSFGSKMGLLSPIMKGLSLSQLRLNLAMSANPVGLIVLGIAALIAVITMVVVKYDEWGAALTLVLGPLGFIINLIQSFRRNWDLITEAFTNGGIVEGIKMIGITILDAILMPIQQMLELAGDYLGLDFAKSGAESLKQFRKEMGANVEEDEEKESDVEVAPAKEVNQKKASSTESINPLSDSNSYAKGVTTNAGSNTQGSADAKEGFGGSEHKVVNLKIERLIDNLNINTQNIKESSAELKNLVTRAIMDGVRDAEVAI